MIVAIIAGGAGTRLWPLSTPDYPKHLLTVTGDKSLLQASYERAKRITDKIYIVTEEGHAHHVRDQLPEVSESAFIVEPARRDTSGCFLATLRRAKQDYNADEPIAFTWSDHYIRDTEGFAESFRVAGEATIKYHYPVLVGIEPTYASTGFGYIHKAELLEGEQLVHRTAGFKEKPDLETAQAFFNSGEYLWNGGYLVGTLNVFEDAMRTDCPRLWEDYQKLLAPQGEEAYKKAYLELEKIAIDYTFNERVRNLLVVPGTFDWMDLGSFKDLYAASDADKDGNCLLGEKVVAMDTKNSYIRNDCDKPVAVIGLDDVVVVNTPNGILVARKDVSQLVKKVSTNIS